MGKKPTGNITICRLFDSIHIGKMEHILLAYSIPKETVAAITILWRSTKVKVRSLDGDTEYFDIVARILQGDMLAPYLFIVCLDYVLRTSIYKIREKGFDLTKKRSRRFPAKTIINADYIVILANTPNQPKTLLHSLERAATGIGLHVNVHKTEYMCFNQTGDIFTLAGTSLKLVDRFTYLGRSVSSTKKDIDMGCSPENLTKAMNDREKWRVRVRDICARGTTWWWWWCKGLPQRWNWIIEFSIICNFLEKGLLQLSNGVLNVVWFVFF